MTLKPKHVFIIGATSDIASKVAFRFAAQGDRLFLVARNQEKLSIIADDLRIHGAEQVTIYVLNVNDFARYPGMLEAAQHALGQIDVILVAHGTLPSEEICSHDPVAAVNEFTINATSTIALLVGCGDILEKQKHGCLAVITSVAGDRGRKKVAIYAAAKAAVNVYLQGLRQRLSPLGVRILTLKPGFVDSTMTAHLPKNFLFTSSKKIGDLIYHLLLSEWEGTYYLPFYWRCIMLAVRWIPNTVMKRLDF